MTQLTFKAGRRLAALALPTLALLGPAARPAAAGNGNGSFLVTLDNGGVFTAVRPATGTATVHITGTITNQSFASETFTETVTGPTQGSGATGLTASGTPFNGTQVPSALPPVASPEDFVDLIVGPATVLGVYHGALFLSDGGSNAMPAFTVDVLAGVPPAVPEPSALAPFVLAALGLAGLTPCAPAGGPLPSESEATQKNPSPMGEGRCKLLVPEEYFPPGRELKHGPRTGAAACHRPW